MFMRAQYLGFCLNDGIQVNIALEIFLPKFKQTCSLTIYIWFIVVSNIHESLIMIQLVLISTF